MNEKNRASYRLSAIMIVLAMIAGVFAARTTSAQAQEGQINLERVIDASRLGVAKIEGIAYSRVSGLFMLIEGKKAVSMDTFERPAGTAILGAAAGVNLPFSEQAGRLLSLDSIARQSNLDLSGAKGVSIDPVSGRQYILDASGAKVVAISAGGVQQISLEVAMPGNLKGLAYNPGNSRLYALSQAEAKVYEFNLAGKAISVRDLAAFGVKSPSALVFAPSGDNTDNPAEMSMYIADGANVVEFSLALPAPNAVAAIFPGTLVNTLDLSTWIPPSTDPTGLEYLPDSNSFLVADSDVDETGLNQEQNMFVTSLTGTLNRTCSTITPTNYSIEPTGVVVVGNTLYITDDDKDRIHIVNIGGDGQPCTADDALESFIDTLGFGSGDATGIDHANGQLFVTDGLNYEVYVIDVATRTMVRSFDTGPIDGTRQPQGISHHPERGTLFIVTRSDGFFFEADLNGSLLNEYNIRDSSEIVSAADIEVAPASTGTGWNIYVADRGVDPDPVLNPSPNDGKIYEFSIPSGSVPPTPTQPVPTPTQPAPTPTEPGPSPLVIRIFLPLTGK